MEKHRWLTVLLIFMLASCTGVQTPISSPTPLIVIKAPTLQPASPTAVPTQTATSTLAPTVTIIPTNTPTITPTFEIKSIRTSTPSQAAKCPQVETKQVPTLVYNHEYRLGAKDSVFLDYLNQFGADAFLQADKTTIDVNERPYSRVLLHQDLTNDGVPEIMVSLGPLYIFGCKDGKYQTLLATEQSPHDSQRKIIAINDLNQNGIPEFLVLLDIGTQDDHYYQMFEWGDGKFNNLFSPNDWGDTLFVLSGGSFSFEDVDSDGMKEIVLHNGSPLSADNFGYGLVPWRRITKYYKWDGKHFALSKKFFDPPQYRLQAVEDADHAILNKDYDWALDLYQQVIFNDKLEWWTQMRKIYIVQQIRAKGWGEPSPVAPPSPDPNEYLYLSSYARFRIMVLHLLHGYHSDAQVVYQTLLKKYPDGTPGSIYAKMAQAFWQSYETAQSLGQACGEAKAAVKGREEEATRYLFDDYRDDGWGQNNYQIDPLCPYH